MAGDWIKVELSLPEKPEIWQIAGTLGIDADAVVGKLIKVWRWFDQHTETGNAHGVTFALIDHVTGVTGFGEAMNLAGWLDHSGMSLVLPNFDRHNGKTGKNRALTAKRQADFKAKSGNAKVTHTTLPREEKRRINKSSKSSSPRKIVVTGLVDPERIDRKSNSKAESIDQVLKASFADVLGGSK